MATISRKYMRKMVPPRAMSETTKRLIRVLVGIFLLAVTAFVLMAKLKAHNAVPPPASERQMVVKVASLSPQTLEFTRDYSARISDDSRAVLSARLSTTVAAVYFREGERVKVGDLLVLLDTHDTRTEMHRAKAAVAKIAADIDFFKKQLQIDTALFEGGAISQTALDDTQRKLKGLRASIKQQQSALKLSEQKLGYGKIYAPVSGQVQRVYISKGEQVLPGKPVMEIIGDANFKAVIAVPERDMHAIAPGARAYIQLPDGSEWPGQIDRIYPALDERTHTGTADILLEPQISARFFAGSMTRAKLVMQTYENALAVPAQAIFTRDGTQGVFTQTGGIAHWTPVTTGNSNGRLTIIKSGLKPGAQVITTPYPGLHEGVSVRVFDGVPS